MRRTRVRPAAEAEAAAATPLRVTTADPKPATVDPLEAVARLTRTHRPRTDLEVREGRRYPYPTGVPESKSWDDFLFLTKCRDTPRPRTHRQLLSGKDKGGLYWWLPPRYVEDPMTESNWSLVSWHPGWPHCRKEGVFVGPINPPWV